MVEKVLNGYYLFYGTNSSGVKKKIKMQMDEFSNFGKIELISIKKIKRNTLRKIYSRFPLAPMGYDYDEAFSKIENPSYIYIRRSVADKAFINFLTAIKNKYPKCKVIVEIFTYPYDKDEFNRNFKHRLKQLPFAIKDKHYRTKLVSCVDRFVTYSKDAEIFGVPTIQTSNGVTVDNILPRKISEKNDDTINLISVARMQVHHGYERLIKGMGEYYKNGGTRNIIYHVVGDGDELPYYKNLALEYNLKDHVVFYGSQTGNDLDLIYDKADIAMGSLGLYKYDIDYISTLKGCEYFAKGFPVIAGCKVSLVGTQKPPFVCEFPNNDTPLDMEKVISFYESIYSKNSALDIIKNVREFAVNTVDMKVVIKPIMDFILQ